MSTENDEVMDIFVAEGKEALDEVELILLAIIKIPDCKCTSIKEDINTIFRYFHSIKGTASFIDLSTIVEVSHEAETLLDLLRKKEDDTVLSEEISKVLFQTVDVLKILIDMVYQTSDDEDLEDKRIEVLHQLKATIKLVKEPKTVPSAAASNVAPTPLEIEQEPDFDINYDDLITPEIAGKFAQESVEIIDNVEEALLNITKQSVDEQTASISEAFRNIHSFKGNCGFMQIIQLEKLSHLMENYLDSLRNKEIIVSDGLIKTLLQILDEIRNALADYSKGTKEIFNFDTLYDFFKDQLEEYGETSKPQAEEIIDLPPTGTTAEKQIKPATTLTTNKAEVSVSPSISQLPQTTSAPKDQVEIQDKKQLEKRDIRVDINKLDNLINLVGELVIAQSMVLINPILASADDENLERSIHHLNRISSDLQDVAMSVRMVPLSSVFKKMIRLVYDLSKKSGKKVDLELLGEETEVDRNIIEQINDPLVHIIRNSIDHGLELPADRIAAGKPEVGRVILEARHEGGEVWITVKDDGRGLNQEKILSKALEKGLIKENAHLTEEQIFQLIFEPGFSTADKITDISGRGVGMDVVKKNIEKLKGAINVHSSAGQGSEMVLRIPLTLAIIDGMLVRVGSTCYTIPLLSIQESIKIEDQHITVTPDGQESILIRKEHIPIIRLYKYFDKSTEMIDIKGSVLIVCETGRQKMALLVDEILGQLQTVIKSLPGYLSEMLGISGCTIMGNGEISLIIDITSLTKIAKNKAQILNLNEVKK